MTPPSERFPDESEPAAQVTTAASTLDATSQGVTVSDGADGPIRGACARPLVGRYVVVERIGAGGMGVVYAATDPELGRKVALKLMRLDRRDSRGLLDNRLLRRRSRWPAWPTRTSCRCTTSAGSATRSSSRIELSRHAAAFLERVGGDPMIEGVLEKALGAVEGQQGRLDEAVRHFERAGALLEKHEGLGRAGFAHGEEDQGSASGSRQRSPGNRRKSRSQEYNSAPCSMASAARCASVVMFPPVPSGSSRPRRTAA